MTLLCGDTNYVFFILIPYRANATEWERERESERKLAMWHQEEEHSFTNCVCVCDENTYELFRNVEKLESNHFGTKGKAKGNC